MREIEGVVLKKRCKELEKMVGKTARVEIKEKDIFLQFTEKGNGERNVKRKVYKGKNGRYYITWEKTRLLVGMEFFKYSDGSLDPMISLTAYSQVSQVRDEKGNWVSTTDIKNEN